ncbi:EscU/YscU/HrcU family type III secretion system export apparatus switch protein [bacterium]|jgi:flagellar biosynthesis protein|nr:EscU/YscU/HrcU family type III secretion system export apparatus switch protein [bacterium]
MEGTAPGPDKLTRLKKAVALRYDQQQDAVPRVVASGQGRVAERILAVAKEHGIDVHEDPDLIELLGKLQVDQYIPEKLFLAVAEVMAYVYRVNHRVDEAKRKFARLP